MPCPVLRASHGLCSLILRTTREKPKCQLLSRVWLFATPWTVVHQAPLSMGFSRQEHWSGLQRGRCYCCTFNRTEDSAIIRDKKVYMNCLWPKMVIRNPKANLQAQLDPGVQRMLSRTSLSVSFGFFLNHVLLSWRQKSSGAALSRNCNLSEIPGERVLLVLSFQQKPWHWVWLSRWGSGIHIWTPQGTYPGTCPGNMLTG